MRPYQVRLPDDNAGRLPDAEEVLFTLDGVERAVRLHDYASLYAVPGLYTHVISKVLDCRSPEVLALHAEAMLASRSASPSRAVTAMICVVRNPMISWRSAALASAPPGIARRLPRAPSFLRYGSGRSCEGEAGLVAGDRGAEQRPRQAPQAKQQLRGLARRPDKEHDLDRDHQQVVDPDEHWRLSPPAAQPACQDDSDTQRQHTDTREQRAEGVEDAHTRIHKGGIGDPAQVREQPKHRDAGAKTSGKLGMALANCAHSEEANGAAKQAEQEQYTQDVGKQSERAIRLKPRHEVQAKEEQPTDEAAETGKANCVQKSSPMCTVLCRQGFAACVACSSAELVCPAAMSLRGASQTIFSVAARR
jgi:hypothetical protein